MKIEYFDNHLVGVPFKKGFRIKFNYNETNKDKYQLVNFLSQKFGEGVVGNNNITNDTWVLADKKNENILIVPLESQADKIISFLFEYKIKINYNLSVYTKLNDILQPFMFEPITIKNKNKIREIVRQTLYIKPYDFDIILSSNGIIIKTIDEEYIIQPNYD